MANERKLIIGGTVRFYDVDGLLHRDDGPALTHEYGRTEWWVNGVQSLEPQSGNEAATDKSPEPLRPGSSSKLVLTHDR